MPDNDFLERSLAALQNTVADDLRDDLRTSRKREYAACAARVIARLRTELESAPALAAARLEQWRALNTGVAAGGSPLLELQAHALAAGEKLATHAADLSTAGSDAAVWFARTVKATRDYLDAYEAALPKSAGKQEVGSDLSGVQQEKLGRYLRARFPGLPENPVRALRIVPGGRAKETSLFELAPNDLLPTHLVMRRDLSQSVTGASAYAEFPLLQKLEALGLPVPSPILAEKDPAHLGGSFIIVTEITGASVGGEYFAEMNDLTKLDASFGPDLVRALAKLHSLREHPSGDELGGHGMGADPAQMVGTFQTMFKGITTKPPFHLASELGFTWLLANPLPADRPYRLVHGDAGLHNILLQDGKLAAILDWELTHLGDPAEDIAYAWSPLLRHLMTWDDFKKIYIENGGDPAACDKAAVAWYSVWAHTRNSVYVGMFYGWTAEGTRADIESFNAGLDFFGRTQHYIARELDEALK
jgi:aminoglycoside phosphotransferase (APT) family kinase protein